MSSHVPLADAIAGTALQQIQVVHASVKISVIARRSRSKLRPLDDFQSMFCEVRAFAAGWIPHVGGDRVQ
jgi:hypothetical protein